MNNDEQKFEQYVDSIRFDDEPRAEHRDKLEKQVLEAYDTQAEYGGYEEPVAVYFRKLAIAACFLIGAGVLFWAIDSMFITPEPFAHHPEKEAIQEIIEEENVTGAEKKKLVAQIQDLWTLISNHDTDELVSALNTSDIAYNVRTWAAGYLGKFGNEKTLAAIESKIHSLNITDPNNPLVIAAHQIRQRLNLPKEENSESQEMPGMQSLESADDQ